MKLVGEDGGGQSRSQGLDGSLTSVHASPNYDFLVSLRALYNPHTYERSRQWALTARKAMGPLLYAEGRLFFEGGETALGFGLLRLLPALKTESGPEDFIELLRAASPEECALLMLDTGETSEAALEYYEAVLRGRSGQKAGLQTKVHELSGAFAAPSLEVLEDPAGSKERIVQFLERYLKKVFAPDVDRFRVAAERAAGSARDLLAMQPNVASVAALTGGYTLSSALAMNQIILAPSVFIYPFMASRIDEGEGRVLIVFGVRDDDMVGYQDVIPVEVLGQIKALSNPHRLQILTLLRTGPLLGPEFVTRLAVSQPTVHHHMAQLRSTGLVRQERTREGMLYSLRGDAAESLVARLAHFFGI
ncbi:ArsR/SmtB family transcription factor [Sinomonas humi]|uniref:ArsR/SmtB family transcription factor n=1 Tax=Sinomonas humi TaxID=1338436 RepID=UPI00068E36AA|nr:metalloregulator ArsR/SmtB family transcription factor [Sinomonas humi]